MRVGVDVRGISKNFGGGVNEYSVNLLKLLLVQNPDISFDFLASAFRADNLVYVKEIFGEKNNLSIHGIKVPNKILNIFLKVLEEPKLDLLLPHQPDVFFMPNINIARFRSRTPYVVTFHDLSFELYPEFFSKKMRLWHQFINPRKLAHKAGHIIAVSESTKYDLVDMYNIPESKISVVYSGISDIYFRTSKQPWGENKIKKFRFRYNLPKKYILFLGTLEPRKNILSVLEAFEELVKLGYDDLGLVIAGGQGWLHKDLLDKVNNSSLVDKIKVLGYVDEKDKPMLYKLSECLVYPSFYEGFGFPPVEAMACGTPVVTSNLSSLPEVLGDSAIKVSPYNVDEMVWGIDQILKDEKVRSLYKARGLQTAKKFSWQECSQKTIQVLRNL
jgi:glycosyltransferase involved in cell wall biosynthesis